MSTTIGEAVIKLAFDTDSLNKSQKKVATEVNSALGKIGSAAKVGGKAILAGVTVAQTAVTALAGASIKAYSDFEQLQGGVETLFGTGGQTIAEYAERSGKSIEEVKDKYADLQKAQDIVMKNSANAFKTAQMNQNKYMETVTSFSASLIQSLGGDTVKAAEYADRAIISMSDNANKMGTDIENIQSAYAGFAKQNYTLLDNLKLGYGGTKTEMERLIKDASTMTAEMERLGVSVDANSMSFDNIVNAIAVVQERLGVAGTSAKEAGNTIAGSLNMTKAAAANLITQLTNPQGDISGAIDNLVTSIVGDSKNKGLLGNLQPAIESALKGITKLLKEGLPKVLAILPKILKDTLPDLVKLAVELFVQIVKMLPELMPILVEGLKTLIVELVPHIPEIIGALFEALIQSVLSLLGSLGVMLGEWFASIGKNIGQWLGSVFSQLGDFANAAVKAISDFAEEVGKSIEAIGQWFADVFQNAWDFIVSVFGNIANFFKGVWDNIVSVFSYVGTAVGEAVSGAFKAVVNGILSFIEAFINGPINILNLFIDGINNAFGFIGVNLGKIPNVQLPRLAEGGIATGATTAIIGEDGKEAVIPLERNTDNWAGLLAHTLANEFEKDNLATGGGITVYMTNNINNNLDADEIGRRLMTSIRRAA